jgi:hypothetical protein
VEGRERRPWLKLPCAARFAYFDGGEKGPEYLRNGGINGVRHEFNDDITMREEQESKSSQT